MCQGKNAYRAFRTASSGMLTGIISTFHCMLPMLYSKSWNMGRLGTGEFLELYMQKYPDGSLFIAMKSLSYFEDAESDPMPFMFEETNWDGVKTRIREAVIGL